MMIPWFGYESISGQWTVVRGDEDDYPDLKGNDGVTLPTRSLIVVDRRLDYARACRTAFHEMVHADLSNPGENAILALVVGCKEDDVPNREERIVSYAAPRIADTLLRNAFLNLPAFGDDQ